MTKPSKTGRGLAALIPTEPAPKAKKPIARRSVPANKQMPTAADQGPPDSIVVTDVRDVRDQAVPGLTLISVRPSQVRPNPRQPRTEFDPDALDELSESLRDVGFLQPIVVRELAGRGNDATYELVAGERRWRASQLAELYEIPAIVRSTDDNALLRDALLENLQRVPLNPLEEAAAYDQLLTDFGGTHEELSKRLSRSRSQVSNTLRLLKLPTAVQRRVAAGVLSAGHARALLALPDDESMDFVAKRVIAEGISVRGTEEIVATYQAPSGKARKSSAKQSRPEFDAVAQRLSDHLDTRVNIAMGKSKGKIVVEFAGVEDLHRIISQLSESVLDDRLSTD